MTKLDARNHGVEARSDAIELLVGAVHRTVRGESEPDWQG
jgi:hypothetical protein